ncbi:LOW QUALITY PROTEIN: synaptonemal complex protein 2 [Ctenodactylus gundi]
MPIRPDLQQFEKCIDDALRKNDSKPLKALLKIDICEDVKIKCSKQFFHKLDDLICRELSKKDCQTTSLIFMSVARCGKNINILGRPGLLTMINQGLIQKMVVWFEKSKEIILSQGNSKDEAVINMIEDLFDLFMVIHDASDGGKRQIVENFVPRICALIMDSRVNICIQQETLKKMNAMLDKMPQDARKILCNQEMLTLMSNMGERILDAGDYDLQVGIVEALCRMTTEKHRKELACQWFSMDFIANAFKKIKDSEFETDCRIFLNLVNGILGDKRRVFTFPCLSAFLDKYELQIPSDEKLEEFWIDFNLGSQTLSFYTAGDDDHQWEAVTVPEEKVQMYSIEVTDSRKLLTIILKNIVKISKREGKDLLLYFDASLEITNVTQKIFGVNKYREFSRKQGVSVAKTSVHILFDATGSQTLVPESQFSVVKEEFNDLNETSNTPSKFAKSSKYTSNQEDRKNCQLEVTTPSKRKMSEASMIVPGSDRYTVRSPVLLANTSAPHKRRIKPPLQMMSSTEKINAFETSENGGNNGASHESRPPEGRNRRENTDKHIKTAKYKEKTENKDTGSQNQNINELKGISPGLQAEGEVDKPVFISIKSVTKQKSFSVPDHDSEETGKIKYNKEIVEHNKIDKAEEVCKRITKQQNHPKYLQQKNDENTNQSDWHIESETTFKSVLLNQTVESLVYRKKYILSKDMNATICEQRSSRKNMKSQRKSEKERTSELNSLELKQKNMSEKPKGKGFTDAAESLRNQLNKRYKPNDDIQPTKQLKESLINGSLIYYQNIFYSGFSNKSDPELSKEKIQKKSYRKLKTNYINVTSECPLNDVYNFNLSGSDEPVIKLGKKNLFSDSETEYTCDESKTDISWLKEPKSKPQIIDYGRNKKVKKYKREKSNVDLIIEIFILKASNKSITEKLGEIVPDRRARLPRRAAKTKINYKDLSNSESESEQECAGSFKEKLLAKEENIHSRSKTMKLSKKQKKVMSAETRKELSDEQKHPSPLKDTITDNNLDFSPISLAESLSSEVMRCPTQHLNCKRIYIEDHLSNFSEVEMEEERNTYLLPKRLCKTEDADHHTYKNISLFYELCTYIIVFEALIRHKLMECFTKQTWKTAHQHLKAVNHQIQEYRIKKLDKFKVIITEALENFEKDSQSLKDLEKDFVDFWDKIHQNFRAYQRSEQQRLHLLKTSLNKNIFDKTDYEETIFTSEMCLLKENMKMLQERFLKEMQEEEILNVRRGLTSLFMTDERNVNM